MPILLNFSGFRSGLVQKYVRMKFYSRERCSRPARSTITKNKQDEHKENRVSVPGPNII